MRSSDQHDPIPEGGKRDIGWDRGMGDKSGPKTRTDPRSPFTATASEKREAREGRRKTTRWDRGPYSVPLHFSLPVAERSGRATCQQNGYTALMFASENGYSDIATLLLQVPPPAHLHPPCSPVPNMEDGRVGCWMVRLRTPPRRQFSGAVEVETTIGEQTSLTPPELASLSALDGLAAGQHPGGKGIKVYAREVWSTEMLTPRLCLVSKWANACSLSTTPEKNNAVRSFELGFGFQRRGGNPPPASILVPPV